MKKNIKNKIINYKQKLKKETKEEKITPQYVEMTEEQILSAFKAMAEWAEEDAKKPWTKERMERFNEGMKRIAEESEKNERWYKQVTTMSHERFHKPFDL